MIGLGVALTAGSYLAASAEAAVDIDKKAALGQLESLSTYPKAALSVKAPKISQPKWYKDQVVAEKAAKAAAARQATSRGAGSRVVTYTISTKGATRSSLAEFAAQADETLNSSRGWAQLGLVFKRVPSGGNFNLVLSEAAQVPSFSPACSADWSCRVGVSVIINDDRWAGATTAWNNAGGGLRDYRHMVINHEVGHWLGHDHIPCSGAGAYAPIMLQQSIDLQGCKFNPWPLASELSAPNLGL